MNTSSPTPTVRWMVATALSTGLAACKEPVEVSDSPARVASKVDVGALTTSQAPTERRGLAALAADVVEQVSGTSADPLALIPSRAAAVVQVRVSALSTVDGFADAVAYFRKQLTEPPVLVAYDDCNLKFDSLDSFTFAVDPDEDAQVVLRGEGIGEVERWRCVKTKLASDANFDIVETAGRPTLQREDEIGWFIDADTFVYADKTWRADIDALLADKNGKSAQDGRLGDVIARVNTEDPIWAAVVLPDKVANAIRAAPFAGTEEVWGAVSVGDKLALTVATLASTSAEATTMRDETNKQWGELESVASMLGMSPAVVSSIRFVATDQVLSFHMEATPAEIKQIAKITDGFFNRAWL